MRKLILLVLSGAMIVGGIGAIAFGLLAGPIYFFRFVFGGAALAFAGAYLLWTDFVAPRLGMRTWED